MKAVKKETTTEIITIEEAIYDYKRAYKDYKETIQKANKYLQNDKDVIKGILKTYYKEWEIQVLGDEIILTNKGDYTNTPSILNQLDFIDGAVYAILQEHTAAIHIKLTEE